jgi:hypothetical protein
MHRFAAYRREAHREKEKKRIKANGKKGTERISVSFSFCLSFVLLFSGQGGRFYQFRRAEKLRTDPDGGGCDALLAAGGGGLIVPVDDSDDADESSSASRRGGGGGILDKKAAVSTPSPRATSLGVRSI